MAYANTKKSVSTTSQNSSMFELEPNPFEQSFASTKKSHSVPGIGMPGQQNFNARTRNTPGQSADRNSTLSISEITSNNRAAGFNEQKKAASFFYGAQKPNLASPPLLTPGGSKRLPPILFSPNFGQQPPVDPSVVDQGVPATLATLSPRDSRMNVGESQRPPLTLSLSRNVLVPNESNLRTGLTPNILTPGHQLPPTHYPCHPLPYYHGPKGDNNLHDELKPLINNGSGIPNSNELNTNPQSLTPGFGSMLGFSPTQNAQTSVNSLSRHDPSQADFNVQRNFTASKEISPKEFISEPSPSAAVKRQRGTSFSASPSHAALRKRKLSVSSKATKSTKSSQKTTPYSTDPQSLVRTETGDKDSDDDQERKRREFLERNRVAASKFRQRKKEYIKKVEMDLKFYENEYDDMSRALNKMCGISPGSSSPATSSSLVCMLETAISKNDIPSSLSIMTHIKQVLYETKYFQRNGKNPRSGIEYPPESEEEDRQRTDKERSFSRSRHGSLAGAPSSSHSNPSPNNHTAGPMAASYIGNGAAHSLSTGSNVSSLGAENASLGTDNTSAPSTVKPEDPASTVFAANYDEIKDRSAGQPVASAIGTISALPDVINGRQVIPLNGMEPQSNSHSNSMSEIRQSSLVNLAADIASPGPIPSQYPNSN